MNEIISEIKKAYINHFAEVKAKKAEYAFKYVICIILGYVIGGVI